MYIHERENWTDFRWDSTQVTEVGQYRSHEEHIVSGMFGRERVHYIALAPEKVEEEMEWFLAWFNQEHPIPSIIASAIAHFWFVSIHPFEDGNGSIARI